jgi:7-cyano-7-deazaguanine synthase
MSEPRAFVLLSGGVDSTTCLYQALSEFNDVEAISIFYGQRHKKEIEYAQMTCEEFALRHTTLDLSSIIPKTTLTDPTAPIPDISYSDIKGISPTYVPFRNGLILSAVTSYIAGIRAECDEAVEEEWAIYFGAHAEDAQNWAYPDCTPEFIGAMANAIYIGSNETIRLHAPLQWLGKADIIRLGTRLQVDWSMTWSCYKGLDLHCGVCPTCRARREGFRHAGVDDPTQYKEAA